MATYSANPSVSGAVSATSSAASGTLYTTPANAYAIVNLYMQMNFATDFSVYIGGRLIHQGTTTKFYTLYVGPGQAITFTNNTPGTSFIEVSGVQFTNGV